MSNKRGLPSTLSRYQDWLHKYCHKKGCTYFWKCPVSCGCNNEGKLNLDTAIAWEVASNLRIFLLIYNNSIKGKNEYLNSDVLRILTRYRIILSLFEVISIHKSKYEKLYNKLDELTDILIDFAESHNFSIFKTIKDGYYQNK